jgi:hypothetical protein
MNTIATKFYPITDIYFKNSTEVNLTPGCGIIDINEPPMHGIHIFSWDPNSSRVTVETKAGQQIKFEGNSLVEGAVYYISINKLISAGPDASLTKIMAISSSTF